MAQEPDIASFLAENPPRYVPKAVRKRAGRGGSSLFLMLFGAIFAGVGGVLAAAFVSPSTVFAEMRLDSGGRSVAEGVITAVEDAGLKVNERPVWAYYFRFTAAGGAEHEGVSYRAGRAWSAGERHRVVYLEGRPEVARLEGTSLSKGGYFGLVTLLFPVIGVGVMGAALVSRMRLAKLLRDGLVTEGTIADVEPTGSRVNDFPVYRIHFDYRAQSGREESGTLRTHREGLIDLARERREQGQPVFLLYDRRKPGRVLLAEALFEEERRRG